MRTKLYFVITLLVLFGLTALPNSFAQGTLAQPSVRLVYFLPSDRSARPDRIEALRQLIKDAQEFYADEMERHGYGRKTFRVETDTDEEPVVHHVDGRFNENYYYQTSSFWKVWAELPEHFNDFQHVYFVALDLSYEDLDDGTAGGLAGHIFIPSGGDKLGVRGPEVVTQGDSLIGGLAIIPTHGHNFDRLGLTVHEIGHAFGLEHDFREGRNSDYVLAGAEQNRLSECAAEWLSVSRFFSNTAIIESSQGEIQLIALPSFSFENNAIRLSFKVTDTDGLHQAQLIVPEIVRGIQVGSYHLLECKSLNGKTATIEVISDALTRELVDRITLQIIDVNGSITWATFLVDIASIVPPPKAVLIPDSNLAKTVREALDLSPNAPIIDREMWRLIELKATEKQIKNLTGLEHAVQLRRLDLWKNQIIDIHPLAHLKNLESLILDQNKVHDITPLANMTQLKSLFIGGNPISDFTPLANLTQLDGLAIWNSNLSDMTLLANMTRLRRLYLDGNKISNITMLSKITKLEVLSLKNNQIRNVSSLTDLQNLRELHLQGNPIEDRKPLLGMLRRNPEVKIYLKEGGDPLPVSLSHFRAELTDASIIVKWITESELNNAGFNILRSETKDGEFKVVNPQLIQGAGTTSERQTYTWKDTTAKPNVVYYYRIEDISHAGVRKQLATVRLRGYVSAAGKLTTKWGDLKLQE